MTPDQYAQVISHAMHAGFVLGLYKAEHGHKKARDVIQGDELADLLDSLQFLGIDADADDIAHLWCLADEALQRAESSLRKFAAHCIAHGVVKPTKPDQAALIVRENRKQ